MLPVSVQLYSLRDECAKDFGGVLEKIAAIGFKGVEPAGFHKMTPGEFMKKVNSLGLKVYSSHSPGVRLENIQECIDTSGVMGLDMLCTGFGPAEFKDMDSIKRTAGMVNEMLEKLSKSGLKLFMHNHWWEFETVEGRIAYDIFAEMCPKVLFEIDTYWAANFGKTDPAEQVRKFRERTVLLHIKDGTFVKDQPNVVVGTGKMDFKKVLKAADESKLRCLIIEFDKCATDMMKAVEDSYKYLISNKMAAGNK